MLALMGECYRLDLNDPPTTVSGIRGEALPDWCRLELNDSPAAAGGIREGARAGWGRLDINEPPTSVGGIQEAGFRRKLCLRRHQGQVEVRLVFF